MVSCACSRVDCCCESCWRKAAVFLFCRQSLVSFFFFIFFILNLTFFIFFLFFTFFFKKKLPGLAIHVGAPLELARLPSTRTSSLCCCFQRMRLLTCRLSVPRVAARSVVVHARKTRSARVRWRVKLLKTKNKKFQDVVVIPSSWMPKTSQDR